DRARARRRSDRRFAARVRLERQHAAAARVVQIADIGPKAQADAGADRRQRDVVAPLVRDTNAADIIGRAFHAGETLEQLAAAGEVVAEREHLGGVAARIDADRGALPINARRAVRRLQPQTPAPVAHADAGGA